MEGDWARGSYNDVMTDIDSTLRVTDTYLDISDEETAMLEDVYNINDNAISNWIGLAGDTFKELAGTIEVELMNTLRFTGNCYDTATELVGNVHRIDNDLTENLNIDDN